MRQEMKAQQHPLAQHLMHWGFLPLVLRGIHIHNIWQLFIAFPCKNLCNSFQSCPSWWLSLHLVVANSILTMHCVKMPTSFYLSSSSYRKMQVLLDQCKLQQWIAESFRILIYFPVLWPNEVILYIYIGDFIPIKLNGHGKRCQWHNYIWTPVTTMYAMLSPKRCTQHLHCIHFHNTFKVQCQPYVSVFQSRQLLKKVVTVEGTGFSPCPPTHRYHN